jgi:hypothetical protein
LPPIFQASSSRESQESGLTGDGPCVSRPFSTHHDQEPSWPV